MIRAALLAATAVAASLLGCAGEKPQVLRPVATPIAAPAAPAVVSRATPVAGAIPAGQASAAVDALNAELVRRLRPDANQAALRIARLPDGALRVILAADVTFEVDSAQMRAETLERIADCAAAAQAPGAFVVHVLGEAAAPGSDDVGLAERRASSVAAYLLSRGLAPSRVRIEGRRSGVPAGGVATRALELVFEPIVEGREVRAWMPPVIAAPKS